MNFEELKIKYIEYFMDYVDYIIEKRNSPEVQSIEEALLAARERVDVANNLATAAASALAIVGIAGIAAAPATAGASLVLTLSCLGISVISGFVTVTQVSYNGIKLINATLPGSQITESSEDTLKSRSNQISLKILCREVAEEIILVQYRCFFQNDFTEEGVRISARYAAARTIKIIFDIAPEEKEKRQDRTKNWIDIIPSAKIVLHEISLSAKSAKEGFRMNNSSISYYAKWIYSRPRAVKVNIKLESTFDGKCRPEIEYEFFCTQDIFGNSSEYSFITNTTLQKYGYMILPNFQKYGCAYLEPIASAYLSQRSAKKMKRPSDYEEIKKFLTLNYEVTPNDVKEYVDYAKQCLEDDKDSFNTYLSRKFDDLAVIANCHDSRLSGISLSYGNFNGVNFRRAILSGCALENTTWIKAHLDYAELGQDGLWICLRNSNFSECTAEKSFWRNIDFRGSNFKSAKMTGAYLKSFIFTTDNFDKDAEWYFSEFIDPYLFIDGPISKELLSLERNKQIPLEPGFSRPQLKDIFDTIRARLTRVENFQNEDRRRNRFVERYTGDRITAIAVSNNDYFTVGYDNGVVCCKEQRNEETEYWLQTSDQIITSLSWCRRNHYLVAGSRNSFVYLWDINAIINGNLTPSLLQSHSRALWLTDVAWSVESDYYLATSSYDNTVTLWDVSNSEQRTKQMISLKMSVFKIAWASIGKILAASFGDGKIAIISKPDDGLALEWSRVNTLTRHPYTHDRIESLAWSSNNNLAAANKNWVFIWDAEGNYINYFSLNGNKCLVWNTQNELICVRSKDGSNVKVVFWNKETQLQRDFQTKFHSNMQLCDSKAIFFSRGSMLFKKEMQQLTEGFIPEGIFNEGAPDNPMWR